VKKRLAWLLVLCLVILSNTAFAANWVYVCKDDVFGFPVYIDSETVVKDGNKLIFWWEIVETDKTKNVWKIEATLASPRMYRNIYDWGTSGWAKVLAGSDYDKAITAALKYAKEGKDSGQKPTP
jgi:hypothetical protein